MIERALLVVARILIPSVFVGLGLERLLIAARLVDRPPVSAGAAAFRAFELLAGLAIMIGWKVLVLHAYILSHLIKPALVDAQIPDIIRKSFIGVFSYLVGAAAAWLSVYAAFVVYRLTPLFFIVPVTRRNVAESGAA